MKTTFQTTSSISKSMTFVLAAAACAMTSTACRAGVLQEIYAEIMSNDPVFAQGEYQNKAAMENVVTQKRRYMPSLAATARELWVYQDISDSGNPVFPEGTADFDSSRIKVELDQPILDPTINPLIEVSKAKMRQVQSRNELNSGLKTRDIVREFLKIARFKELIASSDRVIARLETETDAVSKSSDANIATVNDVQSIKLSLAGARRDRNSFVQLMNSSIAELGVPAEKMRSVSLRHTSFKNAVSSAEQPASTSSAEIKALQAEADAYTHQASAARRRSLPVVSLYSQYGHFRDGGSVFGGSLDMNIYEAGIVVKWDIFNRGMNYSEAREYDYLRLAKEAELQAKQNEIDRINSAGRDLLRQSRQSVNEIEDLVEQHKVLRDSAARAYEAGKDSYINSVNALLAHEATVREWINAKHDLLMRQVHSEAQTQGWNESLVVRVDGMFADTK